MKKITAENRAARQGLSSAFRELLGEDYPVLEEAIKLAKSEKFTRVQIMVGFLWLSQAMDRRIEGSEVSNLYYILDNYLHDDEIREHINDLIAMHGTDVNGWHGGKSVFTGE